jgi:hypothetical protein
LQQAIQIAAGAVKSFKFELLRNPTSQDLAVAQNMMRRESCYLSASLHAHNVRVKLTASNNCSF